MFDRRHLLALAAAAAALNVSAVANAQTYQTRPSVTYQPSQRNIPTTVHRLPSTRVYQSPQPVPRAAPPAPARVEPAPQAASPSSQRTSAPPPRATAAPAPAAAQARPSPGPSSQTAQPLPNQVMPDFRPQDARTLAQNSAACQNAKRALQADAVIAGCNAMIQESAKGLAAAFFYRANALLEKNDVDRAIADFSYAIGIDPNDTDYLHARAAAYEARNDFTRALADYDRAIQINPKSVNALHSRGASFQRKGDFARASADYGEITRLQPDNPDAWAARCWVRAAGGREVHQALSDCNQALKLKDDAPDVLDTRGFVHLRLGKYDDAIKDYDAALKLEPKIAGALYGRGMAKMKRGDRAGASADMAAAKTIQSDIETEFAKFGIR